MESSSPVISSLIWKPSKGSESKTVREERGGKDKKGGRRKDTGIAFIAGGLRVSKKLCVAEGRLYRRGEWDLAGGKKKMFLLKKKLFPERTLRREKG